MSSLYLRRFAVLAFAVTAAVFIGCSRGPVQARSREEVVKVVKIEPVRQESIRRAVDIVGTLAADDEVTISSQADGTVSRILVGMGDRVNDGQVLLELDREKLEYNVDQQKAALARALAKYGASEPARLPPVEQTPDVQKAAAELEQANQSFKRAEELNKAQLVPRQTLDDAESMLRSKKASYDSSLQNARNLRADIDAANAGLKLADRELRDATIRAPFGGYIQRRPVSQGEFVKREMPVMSIVRVDPLKLIGDIPEGMAPWIQVGQGVELRVDAYPDRTIAGKLTRISPTVDTQTRAFRFEGHVPNGDALLKPGTFARVHLATARVEQMLTMPYGAMQYRYGVNRAFVVNNDRLAIRELKVGDRLGDRIEVLSGLRAGDAVALTDVDNLSDGMKVKASVDGE